MPRDFSRREWFSFWRRPERDPAEPPERAWLRPPGAAPELGFADLCQRCGKCIEVCPRECIFPLPASAGKNARTPAILARRAPCVMCDGLLCTTVCPSGALKPLAPAEVDLGTAVVLERSCVTFHGQLCDVCQKSCPVAGALRLEWAQPVVDASLCTGCGLCEWSCPTTPASIVVHPKRVYPKRV